MGQAIGRRLVIVESTAKARLVRQRRPTGRRKAPHCELRLRELGSEYWRLDMRWFVTCLGTLTMATRYAG
jgi:hypothetical protein